ncbi:phage capsid protein [Brachyspira hyodysenteriae]|uniref:phage capsid protein n=1 Tax=Brachyspira hyodysenteriae TaxID=159 RepID=UPI0022CE0412|nr:phage capsid protein [Brachyspira hyodysenteriae]MCZ9975601.1 phage capsid protein [Brachyspira hyodysenteriae]
MKLVCSLLALFATFCGWKKLNKSNFLYNTESIVAQGSIIKAGIHSDEANLPKRGFPVSIKDDNGKGVFSLYSEGSVFVGVALEDAFSYKEFGLKPNTISVCYEGIVNAVVAESVIAGDIVTASDKGFKKSLDGHGVGIVIRGGSNYAEILLKSL